MDPLMNVDHLELQKLVMTFLTNLNLDRNADPNDSVLLGLRNLIDGYRQTQLLSGNSSAPSIGVTLDSETEESLLLQNKVIVAQLHSSLIAKLTTFLLSTPHTFYNLHQSAELPHYFSSSLMLVHLPSISSLSNISLVRVVARIPGVSEKYTTTPPLFVDELGIGVRVHREIPIGYTSNPYLAYQPAILNKSLEERLRLIVDEESDAIPVGATLVPPMKEIVTPSESSMIYGGNGKGDELYYQDFSDLGVTVDMESLKCPNGSTINRHTPLFPCLLSGMKSRNLMEEQDQFVTPQDRFMIGSRVILQIISPDDGNLTRILLAVESKKSAKSFGLSGLVNDALLSLYVRCSKVLPWREVCLRVLDSAFQGYDDTMSEVYPVPISNHIQVQMMSKACGYNKRGVAFYPKTETVKGDATGLTRSGLRYYATSTSDTSNREKAKAVGYDEEGYPIYLPRGYSIPKAKGVTSDGVALYDLESILNQKGDMVTEDLLDNKTAPDANAQIETLKDFPALYQHMKSVVGTGISSAMKAVLDPDDICKFLRQSNPPVTTSQGSRLVFVPLVQIFHSLSKPLTKNVILRYRGERGDHSLRTYFLIATPPIAFTMSKFEIGLSGEGSEEIAITFHPGSMEVVTGIVEGRIDLVDKDGRKQSGMRVKGVKRRVFEIRDEIRAIDLGFCNLAQSREKFAVIINLTEMNITIQSRLLCGPPNFSIETQVIKIKPLESYKLSIRYHPVDIGAVEGEILLHGTGDEEIKLALKGTTEIPLTVYIENTLTSPESLSILRTELMRRGEKFIGGGVLDFGILSENTTATRLITLMNWSDLSIYVSLSTLDKLLNIPSLTLIAPQSATTIPINLSSILPGLHKSTIIATTVGVEAIEIEIRSFAGTPIYLIMSDVAFFTPCRMGETVWIDTFLVNESNLSISFRLEGLENGFEAIRTIDRGLGLEIGDNIVIKPYSLLAYSVSFSPSIIGISRVCLNIRIEDKLFQVGLYGKKITLIGICLDEPVLEANLDLLVGWIRHAKSGQGNVEDINAIPNHPKSIRENPLVEFKNLRCEIIEEAQIVTIWNKTNLPRKIHVFCSACFLVDSKYKVMGPAETVDVRVSYNGPSSSILHGFVALLDIQSSSVASIILFRRPPGFLVSPYSPSIVTLDFGTLETSSTKELFLFLFNPFTTAYHFNVKIPPSVLKSMIYKVGMMAADMESKACFCLPIEVSSSVSGLFETKIEIFFDYLAAKTSRLTTVNLKSQFLYRSLTGLPLNIAFGNTLLTHSNSRAIQLSNQGSHELAILMKTKPPYHVHPAKFVIPAKATQVVEVVFKPVLNKSSTCALSVFWGGRSEEVCLSGHGGGALLQHINGSQTMEHDDIQLDFGNLSHGLIAYQDIHLTNTGSIPLKIVEIFSDYPNNLRLSYMGITLIIPRFTMNPQIRTDYWRLIRHKLSSIKSMTNQYFNQSKSKAATQGACRILEISPTIRLKCIDLAIPLLLPLHSYHLMIGYPASYYLPSSRVLNLGYIAISDSLTASEFSLLKREEVQQQTLSLSCSSNTIIDLAVTPLILEFGSKAIRQDTASNSTILTVLVTNKSNISQTLTLSPLLPPFYTPSLMLIVKATSHVHIPIAFIPFTAQLHYKSSLKLESAYSTTSVIMTGVGVCTDLKVDSAEGIDFGRVSIGSLSLIGLRIHNQGGLGGVVEVEMITGKEVFSFVQSKSGIGETVYQKDYEEQEYREFIAPDETKILMIQAKCHSKAGKAGSLVIHYKKVPSAETTSILIPLKATIGYPELQLKQTKIDFGVTFIGYHCIRPISLYNNGNANCKWTVKIGTEVLNSEVVEGTIEAGQTVIINITYTPIEYQPLDDFIIFHSENEDLNARCSGTVGVPYLQILSDLDSGLKFGVVAVNKFHTKTLKVRNSGLKMLVTFSFSESAGLYKTFYLDEDQVQFEAKEEKDIKITVFCADYDQNYSANLQMRGANGESHSLSVEATGGQAIIRTTEFLKTGVRSVKGIDKAVIKEHVDLLVKLLDSLVPIEVSALEFIKREDIISDESRYSTPQIAELRRMELEISDVIGKLNSTGEYSNTVKKGIVTESSLQINIDKDVSLLESDNLRERVAIEEDVENLRIAIQEEGNVKIMEDSLKMITTRLIETTVYSMQRVKNQFKTETQASEVLLSKLKASNRILQEIFSPSKESEILNTYSLGLVLGGSRSKIVTLFTLPNEGNLELPYTIVPFHSHPPNIFTLDSLKGVIKPKMDLVLKASCMYDYEGEFTQGYAMISDEKQILSFSISVTIGIPYLSFATDSVDFGLVGKTSTSIKEVVLRNAGTFDSNWTVNTEGLTKDVSISPIQGVVMKGEEVILTIIFSPQSEGLYHTLFRFNWLKEPIYLHINGTGAGAKLKFQSTHIDFGKCVVGLKYVRELGIKNVGSLKAVIDISHSSSGITFEIERDVNGFVNLDPDQDILLKINYWPTARESLETAINFLIGNPVLNTQIVLLKGSGGTEMLDCSGSLDFINMAIFERQDQTLKFLNTGSYDLAFSMIWEPLDLFKIFEIDVVGWSDGRLFLSGSEIVITILVTTDKPTNIQGSLTVVSSTAGKDREFKFPIHFKTYKEEISADVKDFISIGRVVPDKEVKTSQTITNNSSKAVRYRYKIVTEDGSASLDWFLSASVTDENYTIEAIFKSERTRGDQWKTALLVTEKCSLDPAAEWIEFSRLELKGGLGIAKFELSPLSYDFYDVAIGDSKTQPFTIKNDGTASCSYEIKDWNNQALSLIGDFKLLGNVADSQEITFQICFKPTEALHLNSNLTFVTAIGDIDLHLTGTGHKLSLSDSSFVPLNMGFIPIGSKKKVNLTLENNCEMDIDIQCIALLSNSEEVCSWINVVPNYFKISSKESVNDRIAIHCGIETLFESANQINDFINLLPFNLPITATIRLFGPHSILLGDIIVSLTFLIEPLVLKEKEGNYNIETLEFGIINYQEGGFKTLLIQNDNLFDQKLTILIEGSQFRSSLSTISIMARGLIDLTIEILPLDMIAYPEGPPKSKDYSGLLVITSDITSSRTIALPLSATFVDFESTIHVASAIYFGSLFTGREAVRELALPNMSLRAMAWTISIVSNESDIYTMKLTNGTVSPKSTLQVDILFKPALNIVYQAQAYLEIDDQLFTIQLSGTGVDPCLEIQQVESNFGVVGMTEPEYREVRLVNPTALDIKARHSSTNPSFHLADQDIIIPANGSTVVRIMYQPLEEQFDEEGHIEFQLVNENGKVDENAIKIIQDSVVSNTETFDDSVRRESDRGVRAGTLTGQRLQELNEVGQLVSIRNSAQKRERGVTFAGKGGKFGFAIIESQVSEVKVIEDHALINAAMTLTKVELKFPTALKGQTSSKSFEIENSGDTRLEFVVEEVSSDLGHSCFDCTLSDTSFKIPPTAKHTFTGLQNGADSYRFLIKSKNLINVKTIDVLISATISTFSEMDSLKSFLRADSNIDTRYDITKQEARLAMTDLQLWKVLAPVLRLVPGLPSQMMQIIPPVTPRLSQTTIETVIIRPPAIPEIQKLKSKKWFSNRILMGIDKQPVEEGKAMTTREANADESLAILIKSNLERSVTLERRQN